MQDVPDEHGMVRLRGRDRVRHPPQLLHDAISQRRRRARPNGARDAELAEQTARIVVQIVAGDTIFSSNRCALLDSEDPRGPIVRIRSVDLVATGNRVKSVGDRPSMQLVGTAALTAVANISSGGAQAAAPRMEPKPYLSFNVKG